MKTLRTCLLALLCCAAILDFHSARAATATWTQLVGGSASGSWNTAANPPWSIAAVPGAGDVADFNTINITGTNTVTLDANQSIKDLIFGDTVTTSTGIWYLLPGTPNTSTLELAGAAPTITVNSLGNGRVWLDVPLTGTGGLTKLGAGILTLTNVNTFTGNVNILAGTIGVGWGDGCLGAVPETLVPDNITLNGGTLYNLRSGAILSNPTINSNRGLTIGPAGGTLNVNNSGQVMTLVGPTTGGGTLTKIGAGRAALAGQANTFTGKIVVTGGTLAYGLNGGDLGDNPASFVPDSITLNGGALGNNANGLLVNWSVPVNRGVLLGANGGTFIADSSSGTVTIWAESVISGAGSLRKFGGGALVLNTANTYTGGTFVTNGSPVTSDRAAIILGDPAGLGTGALTFVNSNSFTGLRYAGTTNSLVANNIVLSGTNSLTNRWLVDVDTPVTFAGVISGGHATSTLMKDGPGTLFLPAVNTFSSTGLVVRGKLFGVTGGSCSNVPVVLAANSDTAVLGVRVTDNTRRWTIPSLACEAGGFGPTLEFLFATDGSTTVAPLDVTGQVAFNTFTTVRVLAGALGVTTGNGYPLMTWGSMTGTPPEDWNLQLEPAGFVTGTLKVIGNTLYLQIGTSIEPLRWAAGNSNWDVTSYAANWMNSAAPPSMTFFQDGDAVQFEDTQNLGGGIISLNGTVAPASVLVNSANHYTFTSTTNSVIAGFGPLIKSGSGTLTIAGPDGNTFTGGVTVNQGTLVAAKPPGTDFGACGNGNVVVNSGARIVADGDGSFAGKVTSPARTITINAGGVITNTGTSSCVLSRVILNGGVLGATAANSVSGNWSLERGVATLGNSNVSTIVGGNLSLSQPGGSVFNILTGDRVDVFAALDHTAQAADFGLIKNGAGVLNLLGSCTSTGAVTLNAGTLRVCSNQSLPSGTVNLVTATIASTDATPRTLTNTLFSGTASAVHTFGDATGTGPLTFTGPFSFASGSTGRGFVTQTDVEFTGPITGNNGPLTKTGVGTLTLSGNVTVSWTGGWNINTGGLMVNGMLVSTSAVTIANGASLGGSGTIDGPVALTAGSTLTPGASIGTLTFTAAPSWTGATLVMELNPTNAQTADKLVRPSGGFNFNGAALVVTNLGPALTNGTFTLFSIGNSGAFATTQLPPLDPSLAWDLSTLAADGTIKIIPSKPSTPTNVTWSLSANQLTLGWPANYLGWTLQVQTNSLDVGVSNNWVDVPGTDAVTSYIVTVDPASPAVFYRLRY